MDSASPAESVHQQFAYGLRFETELVYRVRRPNGGYRFRRLLREHSPLVPHQRDESGARTCVALAAAIAKETKVMPVPGDGQPSTEGPEQVLAMLAGRLPGHEVQSHGPECLQDWEHIAGSALRSNGICLLQLIQGHRARWSLVLGLEWCEVNGAVTDQSAALLLMDVHSSPVWGVGHNARFDPAGPPHPYQVGATRLWQLRTLDGGLIPVRPGALVTVRS